MRQCGESDINLIPLVEESLGLMHKCRSCQQVAELPRQTSHTLQMRKYDFSFSFFSLQVDAQLRQKYLLDGGGNFVADCYFAFTVEMKAAVLQSFLTAQVCMCAYISVYITVDHQRRLLNQTGRFSKSLNVCK